MKLTSGNSGNAFAAPLPELTAMRSHMIPYTYVKPFRQQMVRRFVGPARQAASLKTESDPFPPAHAETIRLLLRETDTIRAAKESSLIFARARCQGSPAAVHSSPGNTKTFWEFC